MVHSFSSIVFYNIIFILILFLLWKGKKDKICELFGIIILVILSVFRFDIGYDYENYYKEINVIKHSIDLYGTSYVFERMDLRMEPSFTFFVWLFRDFENTFVYVFATYTLLTIYFWYKSLKEHNCLFEGIFVIIVLFFLFGSFDQIRQSLSLAIFLYGIKYIDGNRRNIMKYCLCILFASLFHYSAFVMLLAIPFVYVTPKMRLYVTVIIICCVVGLLGGWKKIVVFIFEHSFSYAKFLESEKHIATNTGGGYIYTALVLIYMILMTISKKNLYTNLLFVGTVLFIIASGNLNLNRIANYFLAINILSFPLSLKSFCKKRIVTIVVLILCFQFQIRMFITQSSGCIPYDYIGSENFEMRKLRHRSHN